TICDLANSYLENIDRRGDEWVLLTSLVDHNGTLNQSARDKIIMSVYNITRETTISTFQSTIKDRGKFGVSDSLTIVSPPLYVDVHLMFMANFTEKKYGDGLAALSRLIGFFQQTPCFTQDNARALAPAFDKITLEFENLSPVDVNYVMSMLGTRYLPSAFYKLRMIPFVSEAMQGRAYAVAGGGTGDDPATTGSSPPAAPPPASAPTA
ncbi:DUF4255 domain-containing protein, partial [Sphingomonas sp. 28-63-12]|uniref:DUF4255 domain-containing protein n=1 Tax=Sphingomonas sp. 28-63-12 TaxID=1970434 RepID=UPI000BD3944F